MNISICITTFNEEGSIGALLDSLVKQTKKPDEIVIVDGGSTDKTIEIIKHYQKRFGGIFLLQEKCGRARGRNLGVEIAKNDIIAITDAGCTAHANWLEELTSPFVHAEVAISAGFYKMVGKTPLQTAMGVFLGVTPRKFTINFLPSTRSMAFRKSAWEEVGDFPEGRENSAEDTDFNYVAVGLGLKYARVKSAVVEWGMPENLSVFFYKIEEYAKWDARHKIWWHPSQRFASHNIKALAILLRYLAGIALLLLAFQNSYYSPILLICLFAYLTWSFRKVFSEFGDWRTALWGPILQVTSDLGVMAGFMSGLRG